MNRKNFFFAGIFTILISSCVSLNKFVVTPIGKEPEKVEQRFVYSLPRTVLEVKVNFIKNIYLPGPYRQYAEKYLGISGFIKEEKAQWEIQGVEVSEFNEPDPLQYYSINVLKGYFDKEAYLNMSSHGLVIDPMGLLSAGGPIQGQKLFEIPAVLELSMKRSHKEKIDTLFKTVITDSSFVKIPILRKQKEAKTLDQKAEEAANLIIKIRKRRLKLVSGEYNVFPEGIALEKALDELDKTEKEFIALFTGKIYAEYFSRSFYIVPSGSNEKIDFMRFSQPKGLLPPESTEGKAVTLEVTPYESITENKSNSDKGKEKSNENILYFRIPAVCAIKISDADNIFYEGRASFYQSGVILPLPVPKK